ncbi:MAG: hypothetical protein KF796_18260 [Ramlibacter sp.]|nr:hypothetical protein [Ramlibacter sp.]
MKPVRHFCTLFDSNYLLKGVVMLQTLRQWCPTAEVEVLCMDSQTQRLLQTLALPGVTTLSLQTVEDEDLLRVKPGRSIAEYCWTLSASLCWYLMRNRPGVEMLTYLDADLMFFSPVEPLFDEIGGKSIAIIEHRFTPRLRHLEAYGRYNVEWVSFRRDADGLQCLQRWRDQCIEWCFARLEDGKLGDQKYLDAWPQDYPSVHVLQHKGAGVAPWNYPNHQFREAGGAIFVDEAPLLFYHFHQFQLLTGMRYDHVSAVYSADVPPPASVYHRYEAALESVLNTIRAIEPGFNGGIRPAAAVLARRVIQRVIPVGIKNLIRRAGVQPW